MSSVARVVALVVLAASVGVAVAHHPPRWLRTHVEAARARQDPWGAYLAPESACPGRDRTDLSVVAQDRVMVCLLSYARSRAGLAPLPVVYLLNRSSLLKAMDIMRCSDFSHTACGKPFPSVFGEVGYAGSNATLEGENIGWGDGAAGSSAAVVSGWLNSPHHRENLFSDDWREQGVAMVPAGAFLGAKHAQVWVNEFGSRS